MTRMALRFIQATSILVVAQMSVAKSGVFCYCGALPGGRGSEAQSRKPEQCRAANIFRRDLWQRNHSQLIEKLYSGFELFLGGPFGSALRQPQGAEEAKLEPQEYYLQQPPAYLLNLYLKYGMVFFEVSTDSLPIIFLSGEDPWIYKAELKVLAFLGFTTDQSRTLYQSNSKGKALISYYYECSLDEAKRHPGHEPCNDIFDGLMTRMALRFIQATFKLSYNLD